MNKLRAYSCDVLVVGAGPAGMAAAVRAGERGATVIVVDDNPEPGGQIWRRAAGKSRSAEAAKWVERFRRCGAKMLVSTRIVAWPKPGVLLAEDDKGTVQIASRSLVLATGARELFLPFPGWTLPGVTGAGGLQALVKAGLPVAGKRIVVAGSGPLLLAVGVFLKKQGAKVESVFEQSSWTRVIGFGSSLLRQPGTLLDGCVYGLKIGISKYHPGWWPLAAYGRDALESVEVTDGSRRSRIDCDYLACGFHLLPNTELAAALGCKVDRGSVVVNDRQETSVAGVYSAGEAAGVAGLKRALIDGQIAGLSASGQTNAEDRRLRRSSKRLAKIATKMNEAFELRDELRHLAEDGTTICRCEDVPWGKIHGHASLRSAKLYTRCGMGPCQGRICSPVLRLLMGWETESVRPPLYPVRLSTLLPSAAFTKEEA